MDIKKIAITGAATVILGTTGMLGHGTIKKVYDCMGKDVQYYDGENYYCGNEVAKVKDFNALKQRITDNKTAGTSDLVFAQIIAKNDRKKADELTSELLKKYDKNKKEFNGSKFDNDLRNQILILVELASIKCGGSCELQGENMEEQIYNLLNE